MADRAGRRLALAVAAVGWVAWCLVSAAPVSLLVRLAGVLLRRGDVAANVPLAIGVELVLLGATAFVLFRAVVPLRPPVWFWAVAPVGYVVSYAIYLGLERLTAASNVALTPASLLEIAAVCAIVSAGAYLGGMGRTRRPAPPGADEA